MTNMIDSSADAMDQWLRGYSTTLGLPLGFEARFRCGNDPVSPELAALACGWGNKMAELVFFSALATVEPVWRELLPKIRGRIIEIEHAAAAARGATSP